MDGKRGCLKTEATSLLWKYKKVKPGLAQTWQRLYWMSFGTGCSLLFILLIQLEVAVLHPAELSDAHVDDEGQRGGQYEGEY